MCSYGFELLPVPAHCARLQLRECQRRWAMWGLKGNLGVDVFEGDFRVHPEVSKRLREADVVVRHTLSLVLALMLSWSTTRYSLRRSTQT